MKSFNIVFSLTLIIIVLSCSSNYHHHGIGGVEAIEIRDQVITYNNTTITLYNNDIFLVSNSTIIFGENVYFDMGSNVSFIFFSDCHLSSILPFSIRTANIYGYSYDMISTLKLTNISLSIDSKGNLTDYVIDMRSGISEFISNKALVLFYYTALMDGDDIFKGGSVIIETPENIVTVTGISILPPGYYNIVAPPPPFYLPQITFTATIYNYRSFATFFPMKIDPKLIKGGGNCRYFFADLYTTMDAANVNFTNCGAVLFKVNTRGGSLSFQYAVWDLAYNISQVINTTISLNNNFTLVANQMLNTTLPRTPFGRIQLDSVSTLRFNDPLSTRIALSAHIILVATYNPYTSLTLTLISSEEGLVDCNNSTTSRIKGYMTGQQRLNPTIQFLSPVQGGIDGILSCSTQSLSYRVFSDSNTGNWQPDCPDGLFRCFISSNNGGGCVPVEECLSQAFCISTIPESQNASSTLPDSGALKAISNAELETSEESPFNYTCWNGQCTTSPVLCPPFPACPRHLPIRCAGYCAPLGHVCAPCDFPCAHFCLNQSGICEPHFGCNIGQYQCPDNLACVTDPSKCAKYGTHDIPSSFKTIRSTTDIYQGIKSVATLWTGYQNSSLNITTRAQIIFPHNSLPTNATYSQIFPIGDSVATKISGSKISDSFDYYRDLLTAPFEIRVLYHDDLTFENNCTVSILIQNNHQEYELDDMCLAYINNFMEWECIPLPLQFHNGRNLVEAQTPHFSNFALLLKYKGDSSENKDSNQNEMSTKTMVIISVTVCAGVVLLTAMAAVVVNIKLKKFSPFRRYEVEISDEEKVKYTKKDFRAK